MGNDMEIVMKYKSFGIFFVIQVNGNNPYDNTEGFLSGT